MKWCDFCGERVERVQITMGHLMARKIARMRMALHMLRSNLDAKKDVAAKLKAAQKVSLRRELSRTGCG